MSLELVLGLVTWGMTFGDTIGVSGYGRVIRTTFRFVLLSCQFCESSSYNSLKKVASRDELTSLKIESLSPILL
jgi:hypothetical protein